jgi:K+-sensing histidine kinase KdpD
MTELIQALWDQMRADLSTDLMPQLDDACRALVGGTLGPLTDNQREDMASVDRSVSKLTTRIEGQPINWSDHSDAAHALRGPLNSTIGFSRLMLKGLDGPINAAQGEALETIYSISRRYLTLFNLLLDALLLMENDIVADVEPVRVGETLEELIAAGQALANNRDFSFQAKVSPGVLVVEVLTNSKRLKQAITALLATSVRYKGDGPVKFRAWSGETELFMQLEFPGCELPAPLFAQLPNLLTDRAERSFPYDAHLRLGLAWRLLDQTHGRLEAHDVDGSGVFTVALQRV